MGRGKSYGPAQKAIVAGAFKKGAPPSKIMAMYPDHGFTLDGVKNLLKKFRKTESLDRAAGSGRKKERPKQQVTAVAKATWGNPNASQRALARISGAHLSKVRRIMKEDLELRTYRTVKARKLKESDREKRLPPLPMMC